MMLEIRYKRLIERCALLFLAGTALQFFIGDLRTSFLAYPWGIVLAINYLYLLIFLYSNADKWKWVNHLYDRPSCIVSLSSLLVMTLLLGLIRQDGSVDGWIGMMGFTKMTSSWTFNFFLLYFMTVMSLKSIDDLHHWKKRRITTVFMHAAFSLILISATFGSGDKVRVKVEASLGRTIQAGFSDDGQIVEFPFSLTLKEFTLDEYEPRLHVVNEGVLSKQFLIVEEGGINGNIDSWHVECQEYLDMAGRMHEDSAFKSIKHVGAMPATYVKATNIHSGETAEGWVSCGSHVFAGSILPLMDGTFIVMPRREVKKYLSKVEIETEKEKHFVDISVNHPATIGNWKIYQSGYDSLKGRWSSTSVLECVKDPWYMPIHIALWLVLVIGFWMFFKTGRQTPKGEEGKK